MKLISVANDFSDTPLGRFPEDGDFNGERFREQFLKPSLESHDRVVVNLDGVEGCGSSFLEEAFGGLVRMGYFTEHQLKQKLSIEASDSDGQLYAKLAWKHIEVEQKAFGKK